MPPLRRIGLLPFILGFTLTGSADPRDAPSPPRAGAPALATLPGPARKAVQSYAAGREVADVTRKTENGADLFVVTFREPMRNPRLVVAADGRIIQPLEKPPVAGVGITFDDVPPRVQDAIRRIPGVGEIVRISREVSVRGPTVYVIDWKDGLGVIQIRIAENGQTLPTPQPGMERENPEPGPR